MSRAISSLFECALQAVLKDLPIHEKELHYLPAGVKTSLARVMAKRGLLTDRNIRLVSHLPQVSPGEAIQWLCPPLGAA